MEEVVGSNPTRSTILLGSFALVAISILGVLPRADSASVEFFLVSRPSCVANALRRSESLHNSKPRSAMRGLMAARSGPCGST